MSLLRYAFVALALVGVSVGTAAVAHADYLNHGHHYKHRAWVKPHGHDKGFWRYY